MTGTQSQIEWAEQIKPRVGEEFDRVAKAFLTVSESQPEADRAETQAVLAILADKRAEAMANDHAGYFIRNWQELNGQVRQSIAGDPRYQTIKTNREARKRLTL